MAMSTGTVTRIGIVTGGGDCPGMNAVIRAVAKGARLRGWETVGITGGFEGLFDPSGCEVLDYQDLHGLLTRGGSILGSANSGRFAAKVGSGEVRQLPEELLASTREAVEQLGLSGLVVIGGDGTMSIALQLEAYGIPIVGVPKTIDNDLGATLQTFGFDSAVAYATDAVDRLQTTAESHRRAIVLEVMGRHAGWIALYSGLAGGADVILIPEIPFRHEHIAEAVRERDRTGRPHTIVVAAEGAKTEGSESALGQGGVADREDRLGGIGWAVAAELEQRTGKETRVVVLGHLQRGGSPTHFDRVLCTALGSRSVEMIADGAFGRLVIYTGHGIDSVPLADAVDSLRTVPPDGALIRAARDMGVSFGDRQP
jgi:ATP-dependent phosphofructokinase / diphosphate-dependent phosphofructokinase